MEAKYFKRRKPFDFNPHLFDVGVLLSRNKSHADMQFLTKVVETPDDRHKNLYSYHLNHYLSHIDDASEYLFFTNLLHLVKNQIEIEKLKDKKKLSAGGKKWSEKNQAKYEVFLNTLKEHDKWGVMNTESERNKKLLGQVESLKKRLADTTVKHQYKINIKNGRKEHLIALFDEIMGVENPSTDNESDNFLSWTASKTWAKIIANHFLENEKEIPLETAVNYFDGTTKLNDSDRAFTIKLKQRGK
ncbi:MAG: hypothetical protein EAS52_14575 [Parapedobacter sp.]|nr:MAG: hypothetical protein EAS52_14575 [Parapedobacter sp.]